MKPSIINLLIMFLFIGCGGSGSDPTPDNNPVAQPPITLSPVVDYQLQETIPLLADIDSALNGLTLTAFFEESFKIIEARNHQAIIASGRTDEFEISDYQLDNIGDDFYFQTIAIKSLIRDKLLTFDRTSLSQGDQLSFDVYLNYLDFEIEAGDFRQFEYPATYGFFGWPGGTESYFTEVISVTNKVEAERYLHLLNQIGRRFSQIENLLDAREQAGIIEPQLTLSFSRDNVQTLANSPATQISYYRVFDDKIAPLTDISATEKQAMRDLLTAIVEQRVRPAYASLAAKMTSLLASAPSNIGFGQFSGGDTFYNYALKFFTSSDATADEIHQLGLQEMARIQAEMRVLFDDLGYPQNETIAQLLARARTDGGTIAGGAAVEFFETIIEAAYAVLPSAFSTLPQQEVIVVGGDTGGYYIAGSEDGTRPGAFFAQTNQDLPYYTMPTLAYHEAVPGHHLQIALSQEIDLPRFRREMQFTSFIEGWGLYAERLAKELGWYQNDIYGDIGRLEFEAMRASRLVIDTGIHSKGWTYQQAQDYSQANIGNPGSIARYSVWPGQATAYMTGMLKILELRQLAADQLGANYRLQDFHEVVLGNGSIPLNLLEQAVQNYIDANSGQP
jgi:uncharacterized protein (DUF885 family)